MNSPMFTKWPLVVKKIKEGDQAGKWGIALALQINPHNHQNSKNHVLVWSFLRYVNEGRFNNPVGELWAYDNTTVANRKASLFRDTTTRSDFIGKYGTDLVQVSENYEFPKAIDLHPGDVIELSDHSPVIVYETTEPEQVDIETGPDDVEPDFLMNVRYFDNHGRRMSLACHPYRIFKTWRCNQSTIHHFVSDYQRKKEKKAHE